MLQELALVPLAELEELRGHREAAARLQAAAHMSRAELLTGAWSTGMAGTAADPSGSAHLWQTLRNARVPVGYRVEGLDGVWRGYCANPREILTGPSATRRASIATAIEILAEVPYGFELAELTRKSWELRVGSALTRRTLLHRAVDKAGAGWLKRRSCLPSAHSTSSRGYKTRPIQR